MIKKLIIALFLVLFLGVTHYYTAKYFYMTGYIYTVFTEVAEENARWCEVWKKLNLCESDGKIEGSCGMYMPPGDVIEEMIFDSTFKTFP